MSIMSYKGALKINIPNMSSDVSEFRYVWKIDLIFKEQSASHGLGDDITITILSDEVIKGREGKEYLLSENLFRDYSGADVAWAFYNESGALSAYYDSPFLCMAAIDLYLAEEYPELSYSFSHIDIIYFKFRTYDEFAEPLRAWSEWNDVSEKFKRITLFDNLASYDDEDPFIYSNAFFDVTTIEGLRSCIYMTAKGQNEFADTQFNSGGVNKLNSICLKLDDSNLINNSVCFPLLSLYDSADPFVQQQINSDIYIDNIYVEDGGSDITSEVMEDESSFDPDGQRTAGCIVLEKLPEYTTLFANPEMLFSFDVVCLNKKIMTISSSIGRV